MRSVRSKVVLCLAAAVAVGYAINNAYVAIYGPDQVTQNPPGNSLPWEPATAVGPYWVHAYENLAGPTGAELHTAVWNNNSGGWTNSGPYGILGYSPEKGYRGLGDGTLAYDFYFSHYGLVGADFDLSNSSVYFGTSTDGISWPTLQEVLSGPAMGGAFDYPSVAVDNSNPRRTIVGAVLYQGDGLTDHCIGYYVRISLDGGATWGPYTAVATAPGGPGPAPERWGINGRLIAAGSQFYLFLPTLLPGPQFQPTAVYYYAESGGTWSGSPQLVFAFPNNPPKNNNETCIATLGACPPTQSSSGYIYYAPLIDAAGNDSGKWAVTFEASTGGLGTNNTWQCNPAGCNAVNPYPYDQMLNGINVGWEGGIWVSYLGFSGYNFQLPLYHQAIYFPPGGGVMGTTGDYNVYPNSWAIYGTDDRCGANTYCYAMGDYARIGSNPYLSISTPYVNCVLNSSYICPSPLLRQLFQVFYFDPDGTPPKNTFTPKPIFYPLGSTYQGAPSNNPPQTLGVPPERRRKAPGFNGFNGAPIPATASHP